MGLLVLSEAGYGRIPNDRSVAKTKDWLCFTKKM